MSEQTIVRTTTVGGVNYSDQFTKTATQDVVTGPESVADSATDYQINMAIDVSEVVHFRIKSTQTVTVETNDGTTPDDTFTLQGGQPYEWAEGDPSTFILGTDVTAFFITNSSGAAADVTISCAQDATP